ncbi:BTAD domain-containing putative transcriptional regulator [Bradyrhizobium sp. LTSPM299]|uniref:BTAD domain-containing putative transcriptional regulator n=1 Tax=Bradyrhizobium sp. LTSPM299 TaxID=1619233 RepID=UPI000B1F1657|nr:BTAD domain-containing putative transcriptional regulator [Bradyrhizobium sp. LTSPM299]
MTEFRLTLLGAFSLSGADPSGALSKKAQALLAYLALAPGRSHRRDKLAGMLWSSRSGESARQNLRQCLTVIRRACETNQVLLPLILEGETVRLETASITVDAGEFERALQTHGDGGLARAMELYQGELLEGLNLQDEPFEEWLVTERRRLQALAVDGLNRLLAHHEEAGDREQANQVAMRLLTIDPLEESAHRALMRLYHATGRTAQALKQYVICETFLQRELVVEPEAATKALRREILQSRYRTHPSAVSDTDLDDVEAQSGTDLPAGASRNRASVAVLPFANSSGNPEESYFSDGITEDVIAWLSRFSELFVISRNSSFTYKGKSVDVRQIGRELGVRYVLEGSVRKSGKRVRIGGQLIDTAKGVHIWADRFDGTLEDIFDLQDQMSAMIVAAIAPKLERAEIERARRKPTESLDAYDYYLRGMASFHLGYKKAIAEAEVLFHKAIELDSSFASAHAMAAWCHFFPASFWADPDKAREAERLARLAARLGPDDATALSIAGFVVTSLARDFDAGVTLVSRAIALNPNLVIAWFFSGWVRVFNGEPELAIEHFLQSERLSPFDPFSWGCHLGVAYSHFMAGRDDRALAAVEGCLKDMPTFRPALHLVAASSAYVGDMDRAKGTVARIREFDPTRTISQLEKLMPFRHPGQSARLAMGLRKAGLPE